LLVNLMMVGKHPLLVVGMVGKNDETAERQRLMRHGAPLPDQRSLEVRGKSARD
jgi:hypothetical protein